jgi:hypothetical protein
VVVGEGDVLRPGRKINNSFLYNGTREICERASFEYEGEKGKNHCIMRRMI